MAHSPDYYSVLGLHPTADQVVIHSTWKALLRRYHPDANHGVDVSARAKAINEAYAVLGKKDARAAYDRSRLPPPSRSANAHRPRPAPGGRHPTRPRPSARPNGSFSQPRGTNDWMTGLLLLLLTAAPLGVILVLYNEEAGSTYADRRVATLHRPPDPAHEGIPPRTTLPLRQPAP